MVTLTFAARSFSVNPAAYDPHYHYQLAIDAGLSAFALQDPTVGEQH